MFPFRVADDGSRTTGRARRVADNPSTCDDRAIHNPAYGWIASALETARRSDDAERGSRHHWTSVGRAAPTLRPEHRPAASKTTTLDLPDRLEMVSPSETGPHTIAFDGAKVAIKPGSDGGSEPGRNLYVQRITYTGNDTTDGRYAVVFTRDRALNESCGWTRRSTPGVQAGDRPTCFGFWGISPF